MRQGKRQKVAIPWKLNPAFVSESQQNMGTAILQLQTAANAISLHIYFKLSCLFLYFYSSP